MHLKRFLEWIGLKERLHVREQKIPHVNEGEVWWASLGENIGFEINGKSKLFTRPVIIFKKLNKGFYFVIPASTQAREGTWYASFIQKGVKQVACLHQARSIDYRRLYSKLGQMDERDWRNIVLNFEKLYLGKKFPAISGRVVGNPQK